MIEIEVDGFVVNVPIQSRMTVAEFLNIADKLGLMASRERGASMPVRAQTIAQPGAPASVFRATSTENDFRFPDEMRPAQLTAHVKRHMEHLQAHEQRLQEQEEHTRKILEYLQSLDKYVRH